MHIYTYIKYIHTHISHGCSDSVVVAIKFKYDLYCCMTTWEFVLICFG